MKTSKKFIMYLAVFCLCFYCCEFDGSNEDIFPFGNANRSDSFNENGMIAFKADFTGVYLPNLSVLEGIEAQSIPEMLGCSPKASIHLLIESQQIATNLGNLNIHLNLVCAKPKPCSLGEIDRESSCEVAEEYMDINQHLGFGGSAREVACEVVEKGQDFNQYLLSMIGYMAGTNGDTLFVSCSGVIVEGREENHSSDVVAYWKESFSFIGGTGRFEGATGGGQTNDYNSCSDYCTHHHWEGTLTIVKEQHSIRPEKVKT